MAAVLREQGYAESIPGVGTIVAAPKPQTTGPDRLSMLRAGGTGFRDDEVVEVVLSELVPAPENVAKLMELEEGSDVVQRQRVYRDGRGVVAVSTSWLPGVLAEAAPELLRVEPLPKMTFGLIEERTGRRVVKRRDVVAVRPVPSDLADVLDSAPGAPGLTMTNTYWDQAGHVTEHAVDYLGRGRELSAEYALE
ncbi:GntR-family transcriptional regulator [Streptomyces albus]|nr:GntR-family transcriptional regulator [Streptomyces albus]AYN32090.1 GntR-family transcriptional regulator [Streptomyces albus]